MSLSIQSQASSKEPESHEEKFFEKDHFTIRKKIIDDEEVDRKFCNYCTKDFSAKTSSGNLKNHLREHELFKKKEIRDHFTADEIYEIDKALLLFCIFSFIPFAVVGSVYFKKFVHLLNPNSNYKLPCRQTLTKMLREIYDQYRELMVDYLKNARFVHATTDTWTSCQTYTYLGIIQF